MQDLILRLLRDDKGTAAIEHGLIIAALIAVPLVAAAGDAGLAINATFEKLTDAMK